MPIQDIAYNGLPGGTTGQMLGYVAPPTSAETLSLDMYMFLIEQMRIADLSEGGLFLKRFVAGPQQIWAETQANIFALKNLWNIEKIDDRLLQFMKRIVGWTPDLDNITTRLTAAELRRLIAASATLWKKRGPEDALLEIVGLCLTTSVRMRIWNWFDFRWVLDETQLGETHQGRDPWIIELPGPPDYVEQYSNFRIVDNGSLDRILVEALVRLMRAAGERIEISYISFLDQFTKETDTRQWEALEDDAVLAPLKEQFVVTGGALVSSAGSTAGDSRIVTARDVIPESVDWENYVAYWRLKVNMDTPAGTPGFGPMFYFSDEDNYYYLDIKPKWPDSFAQPPSTTIELRKVVSGVDSSVASADYFAITGDYLLHDVFYGFRVQITPFGGANVIQVYVDADLVIDTTDADHSRGGIGVWRTDRATYELDEAELFRLPLETVLIDINS